MTTFTKSLCLLIAVALGGLIAITFIPYPQSRDEAKAYFSESEIDVGLQYGFERRSFFWAGTALEMSLLCLFALTGLARVWANRLLSWTGNRRIPAALGMGLTYLMAHEVLYLPLGVWRLYHAKEWGMSNLDLAGWLHDKALAFAVNLPWEIVAVVGLYSLLILFPRLWWVLGALGGSLFGMLYAFLLPLVIAPLFNTFTPLADTEWKDQQPRVQSLIANAKVPVSEILVMNASRQSNHTNAYFTGFGASRRIVLYDNLLKKHTPAEVESVLAHELGHWLRDHIVKGLVLGTLAALLGLVLLDQILTWATGRAPWQLQSKADPAGLPLILLMMNLGSWAAMPMMNVVSRHFEREADQVALNLARQPQAFIDCEVRMARDNKGNVAPTPWNVWLFASHPPVIERIRMAKEWEREKMLK